MAFSDTYRESIQSKHIANVGFTSIAKGVTNEAFVVKNPHQVLASEIPATDVVGTYGPLTASGISAGLVQEHTVKLTADPTVNNNLCWYATVSGVRLDQWMRYGGTQYKLRVFEDDGTGNNYDPAKEIVPSDTNFNWEYDASAGSLYFDTNPDTSKVLPLWGIFYKYIGDTVKDQLDSGGAAGHTHEQEAMAHISDTVWRLSGSYTTVPDDFIVYVNGVKQRVGAGYDITSIAVAGGNINVTFEYNVVDSNWVSSTFTATL